MLSALIYLNFFIDVYLFWKFSVRITSIFSFHISKNYRLYNVQYSIIFVVGKKDKDNDNKEQIQLHQENRWYGDILQCSFIDNYQALPIKVSLYLNEELKVKVNLN